MIRWWESERLWWPVYDRWPERTLRYVRAHLADLDPLVELVGSAAVDQCVIQAGGHVGLWPARLAGVFGRVMTFEPDPALAECLRRNCELLVNVDVHDLALAARPGRLALEPSEKAGSWAVSARGSVPVRAVTVDQVVKRGDPPIGALVLDVEGYELDVLAGAQETIDRWRPVIQVEAWRRKAAALEGALLALGYELVASPGKDQVWRAV